MSEDSEDFYPDENAWDADEYEDDDYALEDEFCPDCLMPYDLCECDYEDEDEFP